MGVIRALKKGVTKHNNYKRQSTNGKWNSNIMMGCWLESKLLAIRWGGQVSSHDHSSTLKVGDNMIVRWSIVNREHTSNLYPNTHRQPGAASADSVDLAVIEAEGHS